MDAVILSQISPNPKKYPTISNANCNISNALFEIDSEQACFLTVFF